MAFVMIWRKHRLHCYVSLALSKYEILSGSNCFQIVNICYKRSAYTQRVPVNIRNTLHVHKSLY
jgi:hypothetical protein